MPCHECSSLLISSGYAKEGNRYTTECPECGSICVYVPEGYGTGTVALTTRELYYLESIFGSRSAH
jgi:hypothetical protein